METMNDTLKNRVALVTGGGRGIGRAICFGLAEQAAQVAVLARSADQVRDIAEHMAGSPGEALALPADVNNPDQVAEALPAIGDRWGPVEVLVNNAAVVWPLGPARKSMPASGHLRSPSTSPQPPGSASWSCRACLPRAGAAS